MTWENGRELGPESLSRNKQQRGGRRESALPSSSSSRLEQQLRALPSQRGSGRARRPDATAWHFAGTDLCQEKSRAWSDKGRDFSSFTLREAALEEGGGDGIEVHPYPAGSDSVTDGLTR